MAAKSFPNVVIAGVPKAGTSSLFNWLGDHPSVRRSSTKETFFLIDRGHPLTKAGANYHLHGLEAYAQFFESADEQGEAAFRLEATTHYLYQQTALDVLSSFDPQPHVIFVLRNPADRIYSSFQYSQHTLAHLDQRLSFEDLIAAIRRDGGGFEAGHAIGHATPLWLNEIRYSCYLHYLRAWKEKFNAERLHILLFEELTANPQAVMRRVCDGLGIEPSFYSDYGFPRHNETYRVKSVGLQRFARKVGAALPYGAVRAAVRRHYLHFFSDRTRKAHTSAESAVLRQLDSEFEPLNRALGQEFGIDLNPWRSPASAPAGV